MQGQHSAFCIIFLDPLSAFIYLLSLSALEELRTRHNRREFGQVKLRSKLGMSYNHVNDVNFIPNLKDGQW